MTPNVATIDPGKSADEALETMRRRDIRHLVVSEQGNVVGVLSQRDLGGRHGASVRRGRTVRDLMAGNPITMRPTATVRQAANRLRGRNVGCVPVVDEGKLEGIVTVSDLLELLGRGSARPIRQATRPSIRNRGPHRTPPR